MSGVSVSRHSAGGLWMFDSVGCFIGHRSDREIKEWRWNKQSFESTSDGDVL